mmetsp:Transcript_44568/g.32664  ORF Transcript_44568/g.32664 Transcript_44568/m.32664 type:complete len:168 (+) Transcript_44568:2321-2824(+)
MEIKQEVQEKQVEAEFSKLRDELQNHKNGILDQLTSLLTDLIQENLERAKKVDWDRAGEQGASQSCFKEIVSNMELMHQGIAPVLPQQNLKVIFGEALTCLGKGLDDVFTPLNVNSAHAKKKLKAQLKYLVKKLSQQKFENEELTDMIVKKLTALLNAQGTTNNEES